MVHVFARVHMNARVSISNFVMRAVIVAEASRIFWVVGQSDSVGRASLPAIVCFRNDLRMWKLE